MREALFYALQEILVKESEKFLNPEEIKCDVRHTCEWIIECLEEYKTFELYLPMRVKNENEREFAYFNFDGWSYRLYLDKFDKITFNDILSKVKTFSNIAELGEFMKTKVNYGNERGEVQETTIADLLTLGLPYNTICFIRKEKDEGLKPMRGDENSFSKMNNVDEKNKPCQLN